MNMSMSPFSKLVSLICALIICASGYILWTMSVTSIDISPLGIDQQNTTISNKKLAQFEFTPKPQSFYSDITKRPVFSESRRPPQPKPKPKPVRVVKPKPPVIRRPPTVKVKPVISITSFKLIGVLINATTKKALIQSVRDKKEIWLRAGNSIQGWKLVSISDNNVIMESSGIKKELQLYSLLPRK